MKGWEEIFKTLNTLNTDELCISKGLNDRSSMEKFNNIIKEYFNDDEYTNDTKKFTKSLIIHLTNKIIMSAIEIVIRKVLLAQLETDNDFKNKDTIIEFILEKTEIKKNMYGIITKEIVENVTSMFDSELDEHKHIMKDVEEIMNDMIDMLQSNSPVTISNYAIKVLRSDIVKYFSTITPLIINHWKITIENVYLFTINQHKLLECKEVLES